MTGLPSYDNVTTHAPRHPPPGSSAVRDLQYALSLQQRRSFYQVFQAFACEEFPEIEKSYLRADLRIECGTDEHTAYMIYAAVMIGICKFASSNRKG